MSISAIRCRFPLATAIMLAAVASSLPLAAALHCIWQDALESERAKLDALAMKVSMRGQLILERVDGTLAYLRRLPGDACSPQAMASMRAGTIGNREIDEIGRYRDGRVACNSWGPANAPITLHQLTSVSALPGSQLRMNVTSFSEADPGVRMIGLYDRGLYAYVEPGRFADVVLPRDAHVAIFTLDGRIIASQGKLDWRRAQQLADQPGNGMAELDESLFVHRSDAMFKVVVAEPMSHVMASAKRDGRIWVPFIILISMLGVWAVLRWLRQRLSLLGELREAIANGGLCVHYQPIVELTGGRCVGAEAMIRWHHPTKGAISPDVFIVLAEQHGLVSRITELVMRTIIAELGATLRAQPQLHISVNLSAHDMQRTGPLSMLEQLLDENDIMPHQLWLEVTERALTDVATAQAALAPLRAKGYRVAVDDFGTGYSSLAYLQSLPLDVLKIDKAFVDTVGVERRSDCVIHHIIGLAGELGLALVAEGIETPCQAAWLRQHGVQYGQGWAYAKAMPADQFIACCDQVLTMVSYAQPEQCNGE